MSKRLKSLGLTLSAIGISLALGFWLTRDITTIFDTFDHYDRSRWIIDKYRHLFFGAPDVDISNQLKWYAPLWELVLGVFSEGVFKGVVDPIWTRMAVTASLFPLTILATVVLVRKIGYGTPTALLAGAMLLASIRLGGHSLFNTVDFPLACTYLLAALTSFAIVQKRGLTSSSLIMLGAVTTVPYLIRSPQIAPLIAMLLMGLFVSLFCEKRPGFWSKTRTVLLPLLTALALIYCLWPAVWEKPSYKGWHAWLQSFGGFMWFWWRGDLIVYGIPLRADKIPFWYSSAWIPLILAPLATLTLIAAPFIAWRTRRFSAQASPLTFTVVRTGLKRMIPEIEISPALWLLLFALMGFAGVWLLRPVLYDEERHLLFLYPPLLVAAALAIAKIPSRLQLTLAAAIAVSSLASYVSWGTQSYVYKSPLIPNRGADQFMGDYWGACLTAATKRLVPLVPNSTRIIVPGPTGPRRNVEHQAFRAAPDKGLQIVERVESADLKSRPTAQIVFNRNNGIEAQLNELERSGAQRLFTLYDALGQPTCTAVHWGAITKSE